MELFIILLLILLNGLFSMSEMAVVSSRKSKLETESKKGDTSAKRVLKILESPDKFLSTIQTGITIIGIILGMYSGDTIAEKLTLFFNRFSDLQPYSFWISNAVVVLLITYFTIVLGELLPKKIGLNSAEPIAKAIVLPMNVFAKLMFPFVWLLAISIKLLMKIFHIEEKEDTVTEDEVKAIIQESTEDGEIAEAEQDMVERVFTLNDRMISSIMTHRNDLIWLDINDTKESLAKTIQENLFNVYPVVDKKLDDLIGVVFLKDLFGNIQKKDFELKNIVKEPLYIPENQSIYGALEEMKKNYAKYGLIIDEFGSLQGIVTLKDVIIALLGSIPEKGEDADIFISEDGSVYLDGQCPFFDFLAHYDMEELCQQYDYNTISGLILDQIKHIPTCGEVLKWESFEFEIIDMDGARIDKVLVKKHS